MPDIFSKIIKLLIGIAQEHRNIPIYNITNYLLLTKFYANAERKLKLMLLRLLDKKIGKKLKI